jgi:hypothetical protein
MLCYMKLLSQIHFQKLKTVPGMMAGYMKRCPSSLLCFSNVYWPAMQLDPVILVAARDSGIRSLRGTHFAHVTIQKTL